MGWRYFRCLLKYHAGTWWDPIPASLFCFFLSISILLFPSLKETVIVYIWAKWPHGPQQIGIGLSWLIKDTHTPERNPRTKNRCSTQWLNPKKVWSKKKSNMEDSCFWLKLKKVDWSECMAWWSSKHTPFKSSRYMCWCCFHCWD